MGKNGICSGHELNVALGSATGEDGCLGGSLHLGILHMEEAFKVTIGTGVQGGEGRPGTEVRGREPSSRERRPCAQGRGTWWAGKVE